MPVTDTVRGVLAAAADALVPGGAGGAVTFRELQIKAIGHFRTISRLMGAGVVKWLLRPGWAAMCVASPKGLQVCLQASTTPAPDLTGYSVTFEDLDRGVFWALPGIEGPGERHDPDAWTHPLGVRGLWRLRESEPDKGSTPRTTLLVLCGGSYFVYSMGHDIDRKPTAPEEYDYIPRAWADSGWLPKSFLRMKKSDGARAAAAVSLGFRTTLPKPVRGWGWGTDGKTPWECAQTLRAADAAQLAKYRRIMDKAALNSL